MMKKINMSGLIDFFGTIWVLPPQRIAEKLCIIFKDNEPDIGKCVQRVRYTYFLYRRTNIAYETSDRGLVLVPAIYVVKRLYHNRAYKIIENRVRMLLPLYVFNLDSSIITPSVTELDNAVKIAENNMELRGLLENLTLTLENLNKLKRQTIRTKERLAKYINNKVNDLKDELMIAIKEKIKEPAKNNSSCLDNENLLKAIEDTLREKLSHYAHDIELNTLNIINKEIAWHKDTIEALIGLLTIASFLERGKLNPTKYPFLRFLKTYTEIKQKIYELETGRHSNQHNNEEKKKSIPPRRPINDIIEAIYNIERGVSRVIDNIEILGESLGKQKYGKDLKSITKRTLYLMLSTLLFKYNESLESVLKLVLRRKRTVIYP